MAFYPISDEDVVKYIRAIMGNLTEDEISDDTILVFWHMAKEQYPDDEPLALYATIYNVLFFSILPQLINEGVVEGGATREKEGNVEVANTYGKTYEAWMEWWRWFNMRPPIPNLDLSKAQTIIINGVREDKYREITNNINSRSGGAYLGQNGSGFVRNSRDGFVLQRGRWSTFGRFR